MNKRHALEIIINSLEIIPEELKTKLIKALPYLPDNTVDQLGSQLAALKYESIQVQKHTYNKFAELVNALDTSEV